MVCANPSIFATDAELLLQYPAFADVEWTITITDDADDTYSVVVLGTSHDFVASGNTQAEIRDGLVTELEGSGGWVVVAETTPTFTIMGTVPGLSLGVSATPATLYATDTFTPEIRACALESTKEWFCESRWGDKLCQGHILATAHWLKLWHASHSNPGPTPTGQTTSMTQGPFSQSWAAPSAGDGAAAGWWSQTPEGQQYLALAASLGPVGMGMRMGGCRASRSFGGARWQ